MTRLPNCLSPKQAGSTNFWPPIALGPVVPPVMWLPWLWPGAGDDGRPGWCHPTSPRLWCLLRAYLKQTTVVVMRKKGRIVVVLGRSAVGKLSSYEYVPVVLVRVNWCERVQTNKRAVRGGSAEHTGVRTVTVTRNQRGLSVLAHESRADVFVCARVRQK